MYFEKLHIRELSQELFLTIEDIFKDRKDYYFRDQILRATLSISNNIAEGAERETNKEKVRFLYIARGSCGEVRSMLYLLQKRWIISEEVLDTLKWITLKISLGITKYINKINQK